MFICPPPIERSDSTICGIMMEHKPNYIATQVSAMAVMIINSHVISYEIVLTYNGSFSSIPVTMALAIRGL